MAVANDHPVVPRCTNKKKSGNCRKKEARAATSPRASERKASTCSWTQDSFWICKSWREFQKTRLFVCLWNFRLNSPPRRHKQRSEVQQEPVLWEAQVGRWLEASLNTFGDKIFWVYDGWWYNFLHSWFLTLQTVFFPVSNINTYCGIVSWKHKGITGGLYLTPGFYFWKALLIFQAGVLFGKEIAKLWPILDIFRDFTYFFW